MRWLIAELNFTSYKQLINQIIDNFDVQTLDVWNMSHN